MPKRVVDERLGEPGSSQLLTHDSVTGNEIRSAWGTHAIRRCLPTATIRCALAIDGSRFGKTAPKGWTPLLYLAFTRLPISESRENAVAIAQLLLDAGADPNAFFHAGDSHYTPITGVAGDGEEDRPPHPRRANSSAI